MVNGLTAALSGMQANAARVDRAATQIAKVSGEDTASAVAEEGGTLSDAMVELTTGHLGFTASLGAASTTSDMLLEAIQMGGYE